MTGALINELCSYLVLIPGALLCYMPVHRRLRYSARRLTLIIAVSFLVMVPPASYAAVNLGIDGNFFFFPMLLLLFWWFQRSVYVNLACALTLFLNSCSLLSILSNLAMIFHRYRNPVPDSSFDWVSGLFQFGISCLLAAILYYPLYHKGSEVIDQVDVFSVWHRAGIIPLLILAENLVVAFIFNNIVFIDHALLFRLILLLLMLSMQIISYFIFLEICRSVKNLWDTQQLLQISDIQEKQYETQQQYIRETSRLRHDFRQSLFTLSHMVESQDLNGIEKYLSDYIESLPESGLITFTHKTPVNALLGYYERRFRQQEISMDWKIDLPDTLKISDIDLCSLIGNLLENVLDGCATVDPAERVHILRISVQNHNQLFLSSVNSFDGVVRKKRGRYMTTKPHGTSTGLYSMWVTANKYDGSVTFSNTRNEFRYDIFMKEPQISPQ